MPQPKHKAAGAFRVPLANAHMPSGPATANCVRLLRYTDGHSAAGALALKVEPPKLFLIAGPNGAGKTTFASEYLPGFVNCSEFLNADLIAAGLSPFAPESQNFRAGRLLLERVNELVTNRKSFSIETTLSGRSYASLLRKLKNQAYEIDLFYLWLPTADFAVSRVRNRVRQGGHNIPEPIVRRRFTAGLCNFFSLYRPLVDSWSLYNASSLPPQEVAAEFNGELVIVDTAAYERILDTYGAMK